MERNDRRVAAFTMLAHPIFHAYELVIPIFVVSWRDAFPVSTAGLGLLVGASYALIGFGALPSGILTDRVRSKPLVVGCLLGMGGSFLLVGLAPTLPVLALALLGWGAAASVYHPAGLALISRSATDRGTVFAYHGIAGNVGVAVGPLLAAGLLAWFDWRTVAGLLVLPAVVATLLALRLDFDETAGSVARGGDVDGGAIRSVDDFVARSRLLFTGGFVVVFVTGILYGIYFRGGITFLPDILSELSPLAPVDVAGREIEPSRYVYAGLLGLGGLGQYAGGRLVDRVRVEYALAGSYLTLGAIALAFIPALQAGLVPLLAVAGSFGVGAFLVAPINQEAIATYSAADVRGLSFGFSYAALFGVGAVGSTLAGVVLTYASAGVLFAVLAGSVGLAALLAGSLIRSP